MYSFSIKNTAGIHQYNMYDSMYSRILYIQKKNSKNSLIRYIFSMFPWRVHLLRHMKTKNIHKSKEQQMFYDPWSTSKHEWRATKMQHQNLFLRTPRRNWALYQRMFKAHLAMFSMDFNWYFSAHGAHVFQIATFWT